MHVMGRNLVLTVVRLKSKGGVGVVRRWDDDGSLWRLRVRKVRCGVWGNEEEFMMVGRWRVEEMTTKKGGGGGF